MHDDATPPARAALAEALRHTALALRDIGGALPADKLRTLREVQAESGSSLAVTIRQPGIGEPVHLLVEAVSGRGRRTPLMRLPSVDEVNDE
jgi:hypothetical protein